MPRSFVRGLLVAAALASSSAAGLAAEKVETSHVTYLTAVSVYIDAGTYEGINVGDEVQVLRDGQIVAVLRIRYASPHKAVGERLSSTVVLAVGDIVQFTPRFQTNEERAAIANGTDTAAAAGTPESAPAPPPRRPSKGWLADLGLRGRVGVSYIALRQNDTGLSYRQPALELRLDGTRVGGSAFDLGIDARVRRSYRTLAGGTDQVEGRTRLYSAFAAWQPQGSPFRVTAGRQFSPSLASISLFDGVLGEYRRERWAVGAFTGTEPDPLTLGYSSEVREHGAFVEFTSPAGAERRWAFTTALVGSYDNGEINREFVYLQGRYDDRRLSVYVTEEIDANRGWKREAEGKSYGLTSSFVSARYRIGENFNVSAGLDDRRNVRLYRDFISPETEFDDRYRRGRWAGFDGVLFERFSYGLDVRDSDDGLGNRATAWTGNAGVRRVTPLNLDFRLRSTRYTNERLRGWLHALSARMPIGDRQDIELHGGVRKEDVLDISVPSGTLRWIGFDYDLVLGRHWFFIVSAETNRGQNESNEQLYTTLKYRF